MELPDGLVLWVAESRRERLVGLAGLPRLAPRRGVALPGCRSIHTMGMHFELDLVFTREGRPVRVVEGVPPWRVAGCREADAVVEVAAGEGWAFARALGAAR